MRTMRIPTLACLAILIAAGRGIPASADSGSGFALDASGNASVYADVDYPETTAGGIGNPSFEPWLESDLRLSAESPAALFGSPRSVRGGRQKLGPRSEDCSDSLGLEVREAEAALLPSSSTAIRGGILLRNFGVGAYGSPINPFARAMYQSGFWGLDAVDSRSRSVDSRHPLGRSHRQDGIVLGSWGPRLGCACPILTGPWIWRPGFSLGGGQRRVAADRLCFHVPAFPPRFPRGGSFASLERPGPRARESVRCELRKDMDVGEATLGLGAAYRGIFPGRDEAEIASLIAETPPR